ncbi:hypothetical protein PHJA_000952700 [Phtheirospermum japonicum]|uniref:Uncharacterized protein n=1 Tax=Phtheirospermum japonicum TaxID=374723 RepID=A0A830BKH5_9LAMI|nr:hypothetical protein PHJA_000952700 [Phtheirospermum japonicum]
MSFHYLLSNYLSKLIHNFRIYEGLLDDDLRESAYEVFLASLLLFEFAYTFLLGWYEYDLENLLEELVSSDHKKAEKTMIRASLNWEPLSSQQKQAASAVEVFRIVEEDLKLYIKPYHYK